MRAPSYVIVLVFVLTGPSLAGSADQPGGFVLGPFID